MTVFYKKKHKNNDLPSCKSVQDSLNLSDNVSVCDLQYTCHRAIIPKHPPFLTFILLCLTLTSHVKNTKITGR